MRPDWCTGEVVPLFRAYCLEVCLSERWRRALSGLDVNDRRFASLCRNHRESSKMIATLAGKLRLTPRSNRQPKTLRDVSSRFPKPWQPQEPDDAS